MQGQAGKHHDQKYNILGNSQSHTDSLVSPPAVYQPQSVLQMLISQPAVVSVRATDALHQDHLRLKWPQQIPLTKTAATKRQSAVSSPARTTGGALGHQVWLVLFHPGI